MRGISFRLMFLGAMTKKSNKSGNDYTVAKFMDVATNDVYEFFCKEEMVERVKELKQFTPAVVFIDITSFQGQPKINFVGAESVSE